MRTGILSMVMGIIAIAIAFVVFPIVMDATQDLLTHEGSTWEEDVVVTGGAETDGDVVLTYALLDDDVANVTSITSTEVTDVPVAGSYVAGTKTLTVTGLAVSKTRTLTTTYKTLSQNVFTGFGSIAAVAPLIVFVGLLFTGGFAMYKGVSSMRKGRGA